MPAKIILVIGEYIEEFQSNSKLEGYIKEYFPEQTRRNLDGAMRYPRHATRIAAYTKKLITEHVAPDWWPPLAIVTHSQTVINLMGELIENGVVDANDVEVWMFHSETPDETEPDAIYKYTDEGYLESWPFGWFEAA